MGLHTLGLERPFDAVLAAALVGGLVLSVFRALGRLRVRPFRVRFRQGWSKARPWLLPVTAMTLSAFGLTGLTVSGAGAPATWAATAAVLAALACALGAAGLFSRLLGDGGSPLEGRTLVGAKFESLPSESDRFGGARWRFLLFGNLVNRPQLRPLAVHFLRVKAAEHADNAVLRGAWWELVLYSAPLPREEPLRITWEVISTYQSPTEGTPSSKATPSG